MNRPLPKNPPSAKPVKEPSATTPEQQTPTINEHALLNFALKALAVEMARRDHLAR